jgi:hypothetical protein
MQFRPAISQAMLTCMLDVLDELGRTLHDTMVHYVRLKE